MGKAFLAKSNGGGGGGLAFRVLGGTSAPSSPKPNDIWVNTNVEITRYVFGANQPTGEEGIVWIKTGAESTVDFDALKDKNILKVYPLSAKQYVSGAWVDKDAKSYQGGKWVDWITDIYLYMNGTRYDDVTGGFSTIAKLRESGSNGTALAPIVTYNSGYVLIDHDSTGHGIAYFKNKIDLTQYKTLHIKAQFYFKEGVNTFQLGARVWSSFGTYANQNVLASWQPATGTHNTTQNVTIDVSGITGSHYIGFWIQTANGGHSYYYIKAYEMWLEKK